MSFLSEGLRGIAPAAVPGGALAIVIVAVVSLAIGCCRGCGWGLLLGSSSPQLVGRVVQVAAALAAGAAQQQAPAGARALAPRPVVIRRPTFLAEEL